MKSGWRFWFVSGTRLQSPMIQVGDGTWSSSESGPATCRWSRHRAPVPVCGCGYSLTEDLGDLIAWIPRPWREHPLVFAPVLGLGVAVPGFPVGRGIYGDPPNTWRVERILIADDLRPTRRALRLVPPIAERYGLGVGDLVDLRGAA